MNAGHSPLVASGSLSWTGQTLAVDCAIHLKDRRSSAHSGGILTSNALLRLGVACLLMHRLVRHMQQGLNNRLTRGLLIPRSGARGYRMRRRG